MKVAVVGTGSVGYRHISNLLELGVHDVVAVSTHSQRPVLVVEGTSVTIVHSYDAVLEDTDLDSIVIANPTALHIEYTQRALAAGKHVYLEKPASVSSNGLVSLAKEATRQQLVVAIGTQYRFNKQLLRLRERLAAGEAGLLFAVYSHLGEHIADYHPDENYRQSYAARAELGGGVLLTQIHQIDFLNWIFGPFESVFAAEGPQSTLELDVEDSVTYLLRSSKGLAVCGHLNYLERPKRVDLHATGTKGSFMWNYFDHSLAFLPAKLDAAPIIERSEFDRNAMFLDAMADFLDAVKYNKRPRATIEDGLNALRIVDAIKQSYSTGTAAAITV